MDPQMDLGVGLLIGASVTAFIFWAINWWRSKQVFKSTESAKILQITARVIDEIDAPALIIDKTANVIHANQAAKEFDGSDDLYTQLRDANIQTTVFEVLSTGESQTVKQAPASTALKLRFFALDRAHAVALITDNSSEGRLIAMRRDFITNMSHELKTPIAALILLSEALEKATGNPEMVERFAAKIQAETKRLNSLSKNVITLSEAQTALEPHHNTAVDLARLTREEVAAHEERARQNAVKFLLHAPEPKKRSNRTANTVVMGRESSLREAIANLLANAITHSPAGGTVRVEASSDKRTCTITVTDEGAGIDPQHHSRIFERFFRVDEARSRSLGGTGLGLSIVRNTARTHGGDVTVTSVPGEGATFKLSIPRAKPNAQTKTIAQAKKKGK